MTRLPFKIDDSNYDLLTFEMHIAERHPEFKSLKVGNQPSYMNPNFHELSIKSSDLPGNDKPYCIFAMNLFGLDDVEDYYWECQTLLERPISQLVKTDEGELNIRIVMHKVMNQWQHYDSSDLSTMSKELNDLVEHCCFAWDNWLTTVIKAQLAKEEACFSQIHLEKVKDTCTYVAEQLVLLAKSDAMQQGELSELRINQKYALLAKSLVQLYQEKMVIHVQEFFGEIQADLVRTMGYETLLRMNTKRYVDLVLYHQLSLHSAELEMKHTGIKYKRDVELKSPNAFIYTRLHGGLKADDIRVSYRWLFINAWLCSWLKVNDVSANKAALHIAKDDLFFYLKDDSEKLNDYGEVATLEERHARRQKRLNTEFSKWKKYSGNFAYISDGLFKKSSRGYRNQIKREQKRNEKEELAKKS